ncbi:MAG TPA: hypothetical protein VNW92_01165 [Polyangiaceae bacterium]|jgi:hypothetical protein|nr:hypothetical protein [Polyangiaceae bacterium]
MGSSFLKWLRRATVEEQIALFTTLASVGCAKFSSDKNGVTIEFGTQQPAIRPAAQAAFVASEQANDAIDSSRALLGALKRKEMSTRPRRDDDIPGGDDFAPKPQTSEAETAAKAEFERTLLHSAE